jgi:predicted dehydrogenase
LKKINIGILGLGKIANKFAHDLLLVKGANLYAVASKDKERARLFASEFKADRFYDSYESMANDSNIDVVYIATPNSFHYQHSMLCLKAGRGVLCEKPFGINNKQVTEMINEAVSRNLFLMEAMWTRFIPATEKVIELLKEKIIGDIVSLKADFGFEGDSNPLKRLFNHNLGGGSLLDIGIYPLYLSQLLLGNYKTIEAEATISDTGIDADCNMSLKYEGGQTANLASSFLETKPTDASIQGTTGSIYMHPRFHHCKRVSVYRQDADDLHFDIPYIGNGYFYEIEEVVNCIHQGLIESPKMTHEDSLQLISTLDEIRSIIGVRFTEDS